MGSSGDLNEEIDENHELVVTGHRDGDEPVVQPEREAEVETAGLSPSEALEELGEDVASSPAQRGRPALPHHQPRETPSQR